MRGRDGQVGDRCPLTVVGGFLGAGKTTFINRILSRARGRYAVLVNDFGAVNVDAGLIAGHDGQTLRLTNGCVCCSLGDTFLDTLLRVLDEEPGFEHMVVEASGVGDPDAIADIARLEPSLALRAIVVLADAERIASLIADERIGETVARQVRAADILLLNKVDLVDVPQRAGARAALAQIRGDLRLVETVAADLPEDVLELGGAARQGGGFRTEEIRHESVFRRLSYRRHDAFDLNRLPSALAQLPPSLLRLKGACSLMGRDEPYVLQMVGPRWSLAKAPAGLRGDWPIELVGIGTGAELERVDAVLDAALARSGSRPRSDRARQSQ